MKFNISIALVAAVATISTAAASSIPKNPNTNTNTDLTARANRCNPQFRGTYRYCDENHRPDPHEDGELTKSPGCSTDGHNYVWASCTPDGHSGHVNDDDWYPGEDWYWVSIDQANHLSCDEDGNFELTDEMSCISYSLDWSASQRHGGCDASDK